MQACVFVGNLVPGKWALACVGGLCRAGVGVQRDGARVGKKLMFPARRCVCVCLELSYVSVM